METLGTAEASARLAALIGQPVTVSRFHKLAAGRGLEPAFRASGRTGEKFWHLADVARLADMLNTEAAEVAS